MLSGIGPSEHLREHGIEVRHDAPEVGQNLLDHLSTFVGRDTDADTLFDAETPEQLEAFIAHQKGKLSSNIAEAYGFVRSRPDLVLPDIELLFGPAPFYNEALIPADAPGAVIATILLKPKSSGEIRLRDANPLSKAGIDPRYLSDPDGADRAALEAGLRLSLRLAQAPSLKSDLHDLARPRNAYGLSEDEIVAKAVTDCSQTLYHPTTTCRMGSDPASSTSSCGCAGSPAFELPTLRSCRRSAGAIPTPRAS